MNVLRCDAIMVNA